MKILLKDPAKVDAVIKKITDKYPCHSDGFMEHCVPMLKEETSEDNPIILEVDWVWSVERQIIVSVMSYTQLKEITTDTDFLNDKEW